TLLETFALIACGMNLFDAVTHSFGTIATGGFSPKNLSIAHYHSVAVEVVVMIFMVLSGINFALLFGALSGNVLEPLRSATTRYYLAAMALSVVLITFFLHGRACPGWAEALRYASFQVISIGTSTGFATADSSAWHPFAVLILIFLTLQCACAGSTSGGIKADRIVIFWQAVRKRMTRIEHPAAVVKPKIDGVVIDDDSVEYGVTYISLYIGIVFLSALLLTAMGVDGLTSFTGSAATMGNVGPGFGTVGSTGNFSHIPDPGKWVLSVTMLLGRLEIFGFLLFFGMSRWD
ncbi:MAG TPA: potassium transporter TrkG, partial [Syntrophales bacterium]|nr:potassium transporter TrkG [Syntrophales bacterium]